MERNSSLNPLWLKCLSFAHFTKISNHVNPLPGQLSEPGQCNCKNLKPGLCPCCGEFASEKYSGQHEGTGDWGDGSLIFSCKFLSSSTTGSRWLDEWRHYSPKTRHGPSIPVRSHCSPLFMQEASTLLKCVNCYPEPPLPDSLVSPTPQSPFQKHTGFFLRWAPGGSCLVFSSDAPWRTSQ